MSNLEKYQAALAEVLEIPREEVCVATSATVVRWDSIGKISLVAILEETFAIEMEPEDIIRFNSYDYGLQILRKSGVDI
ncbi:MAG: acyl carrier protein [Prolixibacteraceae bacterium]|nr:acyl carrier protein [Prolixibacteraceae bacterium]